MPDVETKKLVRRCTISLHGMVGQNLQVLLDSDEERNLRAALELVATPLARRAEFNRGESWNVDAPSVAVPRLVRVRCCDGSETWLAADHILCVMFNEYLTALPLQ